MDYYGVHGLQSKGRSNGEVPFGIQGGHLQVFAKDYLNVVTAVAAADRIYLGRVRSDAYLDFDLSKIRFDDMGTSVTLDVIVDPTEVADYVTGSATILADNIDVATAAGEASLLASVAANKRHLQLWEQLGLREDPLKQLSLWAVVAGDPGTGNISWKIIGS